MVGLYAREALTLENPDDCRYRFEDGIEGLVISPLTRTQVAPDVVLVYCLPAQAMRWIQGYVYMEGGVLSFSSAGTNFLP